MAMEYETIKHKENEYRIKKFCCKDFKQMYERLSHLAYIYPSKDGIMILGVDKPMQICPFCLKPIWKP